MRTLPRLLGEARLIRLTLDSREFNKKRQGATRHPPAPAGGFWITLTHSPKSPGRKPGGDAIYSVRFWIMLTHFPNGAKREDQLCAA
jgi:hypothetical protein